MSQSPSWRELPHRSPGDVSYSTRSRCSPKRVIYDQKEDRSDHGDEQAV